MATPVNTDTGPPCPRCGRVEWFGDGILILGDHVEVVVRRVAPALGEIRDWKCMICGHEVWHPSPLDRALEKLAKTVEWEGPT
jgi:hypothetical protein